MKNIITFIFLITATSLFSQIEKPEKNLCQEKLEICFLVDATGSMRPAVEDLKSNIGGLLKDLKQNWQGWELEIGAVLFRDRDEEYLTRQFEKTNDLKSFENFLKKQYAVGGGDQNESLQIALNEAAEQMNRATSLNPRLILLLADNDSGEVLKKSSEMLKSKGISVISVDFQNHDINSFYGNATGAEIEEIIHRTNFGNPKSVEYSYLLSEKINDFLFDKNCVFEENQNLITESVSIFPNPVSDAFFLQLPEGKWEVKLQTADSKIIEKRQLEQTENWSVNHLPGGVYFLKISNGTTTKIERLVVARK